MTKDHPVDPSLGFTVKTDPRPFYLYSDSLLLKTLFVYAFSCINTIPARPPTGFYESLYFSFYPSLAPASQMSKPLSIIDVTSENAQPDLSGVIKKQSAKPAEEERGLAVKTIESNPIPAKAKKDLRPVEVNGDVILKMVEQQEQQKPTQQELIMPIGNKKPSFVRRIEPKQDKVANVDEERKEKGFEQAQVSDPVVEKASAKLKEETTPLKENAELPKAESIEDLEKLNSQDIEKSKQEHDSGKKPAAASEAEEKATHFDEVWEVDLSDKKGIEKQIANNDLIVKEPSPPLQQKPISLPQKKAISPVKSKIVVSESASVPVKKKPEVLVPTAKQKVTTETAAPAGIHKAAENPDKGKYATENKPIVKDEFEDIW